MQPDDNEDIKEIDPMDDPNYEDPVFEDDVLY